MAERDWKKVLGAGSIITAGVVALTSAECSPSEETDKTPTNTPISRTEPAMPSHTATVADLLTETAVPSETSVTTNTPESLDSPTAVSPTATEQPLTPGELAEKLFPNGAQPGDEEKILSFVSQVERQENGLLVLSEFGGEKAVVEIISPNMAKVTAWITPAIGCYDFEPGNVNAEEISDQFEATPGMEYGEVRTSDYTVSLPPYADLGTKSAPVGGGEEGQSFAGVDLSRPPCAD